METRAPGEVRQEREGRSNGGGGRLVELGQQILEARAALPLPCVH